MAETAPTLTPTLEAQQKFNSPDGQIVGQGLIESAIYYSKKVLAVGATTIAAFNTAPSLGSTEPVKGHATHHPSVQEQLDKMASACSTELAVNPGGKRYHTHIKDIGKLYVVRGTHNKFVLKRTHHVKECGAYGSKGSFTDSNGIFHPSVVKIFKLNKRDIYTDPYSGQKALDTFTVYLKR